MLIDLKKRLLGRKLWLIPAFALGLLLLLLPKRSAEPAEPMQQSVEFSLEAEEDRIAAALSRIEGAGKVTVVLTVDRSEEREYARNTDSDSQENADSSRSEARSEVAEVGDAALTVKLIYPRYRGALVVMEGDGSALRLAVTQAVSALTGLSTDKITVVRGAA